MIDWTKKVIEFGESRNWNVLPKRALRAFREFSGLDVEGFGADRALRFGYNALMVATPEERAACTDWQSVKDLMARQDRARIDAAKAREAETQATIASLAKKRVWTLNGLFMEEESVTRYTLEEIKRWVDWRTGCFVYREPSVYAQTVVDGRTLSVDFSPFFRDVCGNRCPATENMFELAADLAAYTNESHSYFSTVQQIEGGAM